MEEYNSFCVALLCDQSEKNEALFFLSESK